MPVGGKKELQTFSDNKKIADYAKDAVADLVKAGILSKSKKFNPTRSISRAEVMILLYRAKTLDD